MKKISIILLTFLMVFTIRSGTTYAYSGGILNGAPMYIGSATIGNTNPVYGVTDDNEVTGQGMSSDQSVDAGLAVPTEIKSIKILTNASVLVRFFDATNNVIGSEGFSASVTAEIRNIDVLGVKKVSVTNTAGGGLTLSEFDIFATTGGSGPPPDTTSPDIPANFTAVQGTTQGGIYLSWNASLASDTKEYYLFQDGLQIATLSKTVTSYNVTGLQDSTSYGFQISVSDVTGNVSAKSSISTATTKPPPPPPADTTAPPVPTGLQGTAGDKTASLNWVAITGVPDLAGYNVYRSGTKQNSSVITGTTFTQSALTNNTTYSYQITSVDTSGNESAKSTTLDLKPNGIMTVTYTPNGTTIIVRVDGGLAPYTVDANNQSTIFNSNTYYVSGLTKSTDYVVTVTDTNGQTFTQTVNTGSVVGYLPPVMPDSTSLFQDMLNSFGTAGTIGLAVIGGAVSLGILVILAIWGWRLLKRWLATSK